MSSSHMKKYCIPLYVWLNKEYIFIFSYLYGKNLLNLNCCRNSIIPLNICAVNNPNFKMTKEIILILQLLVFKKKKKKKNIVRFYYFTFCTTGSFCPYLYLVRFARICNEMSYFNEGNRFLTKPFAHGYRYHKRLKIFSPLCNFDTKI